MTSCKDKLAKLLHTVILSSVGFYVFYDIIYKIKIIKIIIEEIRLSWNPNWSKHLKFAEKLVHPFLSGRTERPDAVS